MTELVKNTTFRHDVLTDGSDWHEQLTSLTVVPDDDDEMDTSKCYIHFDGKRYVRNS
jgi:hypothetical protein